MPSKERSSLSGSFDPSPEGLKVIREPSSTGTDNTFRTKFAIVSMKSSIRAMTRIVHLNLKEFVKHDDYPHKMLSYAYPMRSIRFLAAIGIMMPPNDEPVAMIPNTNDLRL